jgi:hypothetical protein
LWLRAWNSQPVLAEFGPLLKTTSAVPLLPDAEVRYPPPTTRFGEGHSGSSVRMLSLSSIVTALDTTFW